MSKDKSQKLLVCLVLAFGTAILYAPVLRFDYVNYDDPLYIINNQHIRTLGWQTLDWCFQSGYAHMWHPLTWLSHLLDVQLYGVMKPGGHHATNVILHIFNSTLLFVILNRMTKALWRSAMVAALFAWHPLHVESVAWIAERKDVLSAFFWMLTMWAYVRYAQTGKPDAPKRAGKKSFFYSLALVFFALGLMSKPMLVTLPFVLLLLDCWPLQRVQLTTGETPNSKQTIPWRTVRSLLAEKIPFLALSVIASVLALNATRKLAVPFGNYGVGLRVDNAALNYLRYVEKMVWPKDMVVVYPPEFHPPVMELVTAGLFLIIVSVAALRLCKARPFWLVGWLWYLGVLFPVMGLIQVGAQTMGDHYTYIPSIGIFVIFCWEVCDIAAGWSDARAILGAAAGIVVGVCFVLSSRQLQYWRNPAALFEHTLEVMPNNYMAHADYAAYLRDSNQLELAKEHCGIAIKLAPRLGWPHTVLGGIYFLEGKLDQANAQLQTSFELDHLPEVHLTLGAVALARNKPAEALTNYEALRANDPSDPQAYCGIGQSLAMLGKLDEAQAQMAEALRLAPQFASAHYQMGAVLVRQRKNQEAVSEFRAALAIQPNRDDVLNDLAWLLATDPHPELRNGDEAVQDATKACKISGYKNAVMIGTLAAAWAEAGQFDHAIQEAQQAHDVAMQEGATNLAARNLQLMELYRSHHAYHEN